MIPRHHYRLSRAREALGEKFFEGAQIELEGLSSPDCFQCPRFRLRKADGSVVAIRPRIVIGCDGRGTLSIFALDETRCRVYLECARHGS